MEIVPHIFKHVYSSVNTKRLSVIHDVLFYWL